MAFLTAENEVLRGLRDRRESERVDGEGADEREKQQTKGQRPDRMKLIEAADTLLILAEWCPKGYPSRAGLKHVLVELDKAYDIMQVQPDDPPR